MEILRCSRKTIKNSSLGKWKTYKGNQIKMDEYTEVVSIGVNCEGKSIKYTKRLLFYENLMGQRLSVL